MPGRINDDDIQALRERADIVAVVGDYTALKGAGARLKGLCPFHDEKTPSFTVDPTRGLFHCFGCQVGGDVYGFLQQIEALSFPEAVERLARITGFPLRYEELSPGQRSALGRRTRLTEALGEAARFFERALAGRDGGPARAYLASRGIDRSDAEHFRLGWAPDAWDTLVGHLRGAGFTAEEMADAGLATQGANGPIDRFRGRVVFPILDKAGKDVVAFGGRLLPGVALRTAPREGAPPKYINSPETEVYRKAQVLYGLNWARAEIQRRDTALVVEGYMDVIGLHTAGVRHAVATCGTALTADHFRQLEHFAPRVVLALDADEAGAAAAERARALAEEVGVREIGVLPLPEGTDPADLAADGAERVELALRQVKTAVEFQIEHLLRRADVTTPEGQVAAYRATFPLLARLGDRALRYRYIRDVVAPAVGLSADRIESELDAPPAPAAAARGASPAP
ncbi:MAG TPA: DNA primase, partial [Egibacteraceae bacterium]|nr:DNA primase [Egibacteraceae bacterium]